MTWPSPEEFREAIQFPAHSVGDPKLARGAVQVDTLGLPSVSSGNFASVYKIECDGINYAFRCFLSPAHERAERYRALTDFIIHDDLECTVDFEYIDRGIMVRGSWFPAVKMQWVEGIELDTFINLNAGDPTVLTKLAQEFANMMRNLFDAGIAHADLQHGNIVVTPQGLRLIDYDGMFVPELKGRMSNELGHRNYQHPARTDEHFGPYLDNFSAWLIHLSIQCIARDRALWRGLRDCLIFSYADLIKPERSMAFSVIEHHSDEYVRQCGKRLRHLLAMEPSEVPPIHSKFEMDKLPDLLTPSKMRDLLIQEAEEELVRPAPPAVHILNAKQQQDKADRLRVTSEVKYLGLPMGVPEPALIRALRERGFGMVEAGRDRLRAITHYRTDDTANMLTVGEFPWVPYFCFAYFDGNEVLVKVTGQIEPSVIEKFAAWARTTMRGTWVTDGTSRFQFWEDSGRVTYELANFKPRMRYWTSSWFDLGSDDIPRMHMRTRGKYQLAEFRWGAERANIQPRIPTFRQTMAGNMVTLRVAEPLKFVGIAMTGRLHFVRIPGAFHPESDYLYQVRFDIPPGMKLLLRQNLVHHYGWPNPHDVWADGCATSWSSDNTTIRWEEDYLYVTYEPLATLVDTRRTEQKIADFFKPKGRRNAPPSNESPM
jgi:hypothetical protein